MDIKFNVPAGCPYNPESFSSFCNRSRGVTSEGDAESIAYKSQVVSRGSSQHRILRLKKKEVAPMPPLATFGDLKIANEASEMGNKSFNQSAKSLGKIHV